MLFSEVLRVLWEGLVVEGVDPSDREVAQRLGVNEAVMMERAISDEPLAPADLAMVIMAWNAAVHCHRVVLDGGQLQLVPRS